MIKTPWGSWDILATKPDVVKILTLDPGQRLSLQSHNFRTEIWIATQPGLRGLKSGKEFDLEPGINYLIPEGSRHRLWNPTDERLSVVELIFGRYSENDITRYEDDYGRSTT